ncbi:MAG: FecR domain-containing protein [Candidatus Riflebacteria bacterium]|nr:FecR domain-containing protein [Candidatus Riflebacteria bacterium]
MKSEKCEHLIDEIASCRVLSAQAKLHIEECSWCRNTREIAEKTCEIGTAFVLSPSLSLQKKIMSRIESEKTANPGNNVSDASNTRLKSNFIAKLKAFFSFQNFAMSFVLLLCTIYVIGLLFKSSDLSGNSFQIIKSGNIISQLPVEKTLKVGNETLKILTNEGASIEVSGPSLLKIESHGFFLENGKTMVSVKPQETPYCVFSPHATIKVIGTEFIVRVEHNSTNVQVISGKVMVSPLIGKPTTLSSGQIVNITESLQTNNSGEKQKLASPLEQ